MAPPAPRFALLLTVPLGLAGLVFAGPVAGDDEPGRGSGGPALDRRHERSTATTTTTTVAPTAVEAMAIAAVGGGRAAAAPMSAAEMGAAALARLRYPVSALGYQITFVAGRSGLLGKTNCSTHVVTVYVRPYQTVEQVAFVTAFELAHAVDCGHMTDATRTAWAAMRGFRPGWTWFPSCTCAEDRYGSGDFAMVFARWLTGTAPYGWRSQLAGAPANVNPLLPMLRPATLET
jgi:hypothetical protein